MSEFHKKLLKMYEHYLLEGDAPFDEWMILHAETEHKRSVQMAGDLGKALSQVGDLERTQENWVNEMREIIEIPSIQGIRGEARSFFDVMKDVIKEREKLINEIPLPPPPKPEM